jgi:3D (Asp-Asp-Asp) domain-containing protein
MASRVVPLVCAFLIALTAAPTTVSGQTGHRRHTKKPAPRAFVATAYCDGGKTATGVLAHEGIAAADPDVIPMGTRIRVLDVHKRRLGSFRVMDTGRKIQGRRVDIFLKSCARARRFGRKPVHVTIVTNQ